MARHAKLLGVYIVAVIVLSSLSLTVATAVENGGVGGRPARPREDNPRSESIFVHELNLGSTIEDAVTVINNTDEPKRVEITAVDGLVSSGGAFACKQKAEPLEQAGKWITLSQTLVDVGPKGQIEVPFTITVPTDASVGEQNACITFQSVEAPVDSGVNGVQLSFRSAIRVAITIPGDIIRELKFGNRSVLFKDDKITLSEKLINSGNVSIDTNLKTSLSPLLFGSPEEKGGEYPVLRGQEAEFNFDYSRPYWGGLYRIQSTANYSSDASKSLGESSEKTSQLTNTKIIFIIPKTGAIAVYVVVLLLVAGALALVILRRKRKAYMHQNAEMYKIQSGDTVQSVAESVGMSWKDLAKLNDIKAPYDLSTIAELKVLRQEKINKVDEASELKNIDEHKAITSKPKNSSKKPVSTTSKKSPKKPTKSSTKKASKKSSK